MGLASDYIQVTDSIGRIYFERFSEGNAHTILSLEKLSFMETKFF
jgi:hypothetical protein